LDLDPEQETAETADTFRELRLAREGHPVEPLFAGKWRDRAPLADAKKARSRLPLTGDDRQSPDSLATNWQRLPVARFDCQKLAMTATNWR
jgi:hypothetical protein